MKKYQEYKETGLDWLAEIPKHWDWLYLSQASSEQQIKNSDNQENNVLSLSYGNIINKKDINFGLVPKEYDTYQIVHNGNIILRLTDLQNDKKSLRTGLVTQTGIITSAYTCLKPKANSAYLHYLLHSFDTQKVFYGLGGGVRQSISYTDIRNIRVSVPPKDEQDQIVKFLDYKISKINKFIKNKKKLIELLNEQKQAVINHAVTKELFPNSNIIQVKFKKLLSISSGTALTNNKLSSNGVNPVYGGGKIIGYYENYNINSAHLVIGRVGANCGCVTDIKDNAWATDNALVITPKDITKEYLYYLLVNANLNQLNAANAQPLITATKVLEKLTHFVEDTVIQSQIINYITSNLNRINSIISKTQKEIDLIQEYKTSLISSVVTGQVDVRDVVVPNFTEEEFNDIDEVAEEVEPIHNEEE